MSRIAILFFIALGGIIAFPISDAVLGGIEVEDAIIRWVQINIGAAVALFIDFMWNHKGTQ